MVNSLAIYIDCGRKVGQARRRHDEALASNLQEWMRKALRLENMQDHETIMKAFRQAYREEFPTV